MASNPDDPPRYKIQQVFDTTVLDPPGEPPVSTLWNRDNIPIQTNQLIVAYKCRWNVRNYVFPKRLYQTPGKKVSKFLEKTNNAPSL